MLLDSTKLDKIIKSKIDALMIKSQQGDFDELDLGALQAYIDVQQVLNIEFRAEFERIVQPVIRGDNNDKSIKQCRCGDRDFTRAYDWEEI